MDDPLIEITPDMIESGVATMREFHFGEREAEIVEAIYLTMEGTRRANNEKEHGTNA